MEATSVVEHVESTSRDVGALQRNNRDAPLQLELRVMGKPSKRVTFEGGTFWDLVRIFLQGDPQNPTTSLLYALERRRPSC